MTVAEQPTATDPTVQWWTVPRHRSRPVIESQILALQARSGGESEAAIGPHDPHSRALEFTPGPLSDFARKSAVRS